MSRGHGPHIERLSDLLADRAVQGVALDEAAELDRLLAGTRDIDAASFELAAAAIDRAFAAAAGEDPASAEYAMSAHLRDRVEAAAIEAFGRDDLVRSVRPGAGVRAGEKGSTGAMDLRRRSQGQSVERSPLVAWGGWLAAAAAVVVAALGWMRGGGDGAVPAQRTLASVLAASDRVQWSWGAWPAKPASEGGVEFPAQRVKGDVTWSTATQTGVMRFVGLPKNNPTELQYQLWIIDPAQKHPIDGGVFNVDTDGEVLVTITPKIRVSRAAAFAITAEKPGGVVVSDQSTRVVIAAAPAPKG